MATRITRPFYFAHTVIQRKIVKPTLTNKLSNKILFRIPQQHLYTSVQRLFKIGDDDEVMLLVGTTEKSSKIKYKDLVSKVGDRTLVQVKSTKKVEDVPRFRIMSDVDLEIAARKARTETGVMRSHEIYGTIFYMKLFNHKFTETQNGRLKLKFIEIKSKIHEKDLDIHLPRIQKWLRKGYFVNIEIKITKYSNKDDAEHIKAIIEKNINEWLKENDQIVTGRISSRLIISIK